jgi:hypothetical protein
MSQSAEALRCYVDELSERFAKLDPPFYVQPGRDCGGYVRMYLSPIPPEEFDAQLIPVVGEAAIRRFYDGVYGKDCPVALCISSFLFDTIPDCCSVSDGPRITLDKKRLIERINTYISVVNAQDMPITVSLRLANVSIENDFAFTDEVHFRNASENEIRSRYPVDQTLIGVSQAVARNWFKHKVEVVLSSKGKGRELDLLDRHEEQDNCINSIIHPFVLSGLQDEVHASVTHYRYDTTLRCTGHTRNVDRVRLEPSLLTLDHIKRLKDANKVLGALATDDILRTAVDRFISGLAPAL